MSPKYDVTSNGSLLIKNTQLGDYGRYTCVANNKINIERKSIYIYVIGESFYFRSAFIDLKIKSVIVNRFHATGLF